MFDIWGFLLQTLTASGVGILLLIIKVLFKDKLPPKWHFYVWSVLGTVLLLPAGMGGRYTLFNWRLVVEIIKTWVGDHSAVNVVLPVPILTSAPVSVFDWIFIVYIAGEVICILKYVRSYVGLRITLKRGKEIDMELAERVYRIASTQNVKVCTVKKVEGLSNAFVCGIIRPILALPSKDVIDDKIILHEIIHLKNRDTVWSVIICFFKCVHWCNPFLLYCADRALNDMESRCDQYVLESVEGEERREYGLMLLSMVNERYSKTPGSTSINNGGKNIRARIENIAGFKKYPQGMKLVSVCVLVLLFFPVVVGAQSDKLYDFNSVKMTLASARSTLCTTAAGAFDAYAKAILERNGYYRAMCAPEYIQDDILNEMVEKADSVYPIWDPGLEEWADSNGGYYIYNLKKISRSSYEGLLVVKLNYPPDGKAEEEGMIYLATQNLRAENQEGRWVIIPQEEFKHYETYEQNLLWECNVLPAITYVGEAKNVRVEMSVQTVFTVDNTVTNNNFLFGSTSYFDTTPKPHSEFLTANRSYYTELTYQGNNFYKEEIVHIGLSTAPVYYGEKRPVKLEKPSGDNRVSSSYSGEVWLSKKLNPEWENPIVVDGGGASFDPKKESVYPEYYAADLYINNEKTAQFELILAEGADK